MITAPPATHDATSAESGSSYRPITPESLGDPGFKKEYGLRYAHVAGAMYKGIASASLVINMGRSRLLGFLGTGGHTDQGVALALMPAMFRLRDDLMARHRYHRKIRVGAAGGIGTPHAAAAAFVMGADFILTGSINQCTVEAGTSDAVKDMLQEINVQDTAYAPAGDMFEIGARVQVLKKGLFFPARANKLH